MKFIISCVLILSIKIVSAQTQNFTTSKGTLSITPIFHSAMVMQWQGKTVFIDPYGGAERFKKFNDPGVIIITHQHPDHLDEETLKGLNLTNTTLIAPQIVIDNLKNKSFKKILKLDNNTSTEINNFSVMALPMYNLPEETARHKKGEGNGYVISVGGKNIYISGDTEDIKEMRSLKSIDIAFVCMNLPYTMDVKQAADAVLAFKPKTVYPFHYRGGEGKFSDVNKFKALVNEQNKNISVNILNWYPQQAGISK